MTTRFHVKRFVKSLVSGKFWEFSNLILSTVNILLTLWLLVFRVADHESETILFLQLVVLELDHLYQWFSYLACVIEHRNLKDATPKVSIFKPL